MPKRLYLVRHARAEAANSGGDAARRLTAEGRAAFEAHVRSLKATLQVVRVVASPYTRARETAQLLAAALGVRADPEQDLAAGASGAREVLRLAARHGPGTALVGHNPELGAAVSSLAGREVEFPPGAIAAVDLVEGEPSLAWIRVP